MDLSQEFEASVAANVTLGNSSTNGFDITEPSDLDMVELDETITLSEDDDDILEFEEPDMEILRVIPKSKSQLVTPRVFAPDNDDVEIVEVEDSSLKTCINPKKGYIKEFIQVDGLGIIFSMGSGPVLFNMTDIWIDGRPVDLNSPQSSKELALGTAIEFLELQVEDPEFEAFSPDKIIRQAIIGWIGGRPNHLWRTIKSTNRMEALKIDRQAFLEMVNRKKFVALDMVRAGGEICGYLSDEHGIIAGRCDGELFYVFFHYSDVFFFRDALVLEGDDSIFDVLPVGLRVRFDAVLLKNRIGEVRYQACGVFVGAWPAVPHPTLLPGGQGTFAPCYDVPRNQTFYYLQLNLNNSLARKERDFYDVVRHLRGPLKSHFLGYGPTIDCFDHYLTWREVYAPDRFKQWRDRGRNENREPKRNYHVFSREAPEPSEEQNRFIVKAEIKVKNEPIFVKSEFY